MVKQIGLTLLVFSLLVSSVYASEPSPWTTETTNSDKTLAKFKFGLKNFLFGWTEFFQEPYEANQEKRSVLDGVGTGFVNGIADTLGGAAHLITSPCPTIDLSLPEGGVNL